MITRQRERGGVGADLGDMKRRRGCVISGAVKNGGRVAKSRPMLTPSRSPSRRSAAFEPLGEGEGRWPGRHALQLSLVRNV
jgi:hypothetical protein